MTFTDDMQKKRTSDIKTARLKDSLEVRTSNDV